MTGAGSGSTILKAYVLMVWYRIKFFFGILIGLGMGWLIWS